jgi:hypothetical protein
MIGPSWFADGESAVALMCMHFAVGAVLIAGFAWVGAGRWRCVEETDEVRRTTAKRPAGRLEVSERRS